MRKTIISLFALILAICVLGSNITNVNAYAATKTNEEKELDALIKYRDSLIRTGASEADISYANAAIQCQQNLVNQVKAQAEATKVQKEAANAALKSQEELIKQYEAALKKAGIPLANGVILVGDSRFVQMHEAMGETGAKYFAQNAQGYKWFSETAIPNIDKCVGKGIKIVINLGVNDPGNADKYVALVNAKAAEWTAKGAKVYYATVNPVWDNPYTTEEQVKMINSKLVAGLQGVKIIDTHTYLMNNGYKLRDGLHYDVPTYQAIYTYIINNL